MKVEWTVEKAERRWACRVPRANMWQQYSLSAVQRNTAFVEQSWWPEFDMFGSMPWCAFPWHKLLPRLAQKNCCTVYHPNLIHECTSFFSTKVIFAGLPRKAFPRKVGKGRHWTPVRKQQQRFAQDQPKWYFWKNLKEQLNLLLEWRLNERWRRLSVQSSTC